MIRVSRTHLLPLLACAIGLLPATLPAATFIVTSVADTAGSTCSSTCTLRQAINAANATPTADTINFAITTPPRGELLIQPATSLPNITAPLTINGYSQSGTRVNDDSEFSNAVLRVRLDGTSAGGSGVGLAVCAADVSIRGLAITRFNRGVAVGFSNSSAACTAGNTQVHGNFLGLPSTGNSAQGNATNLIARTLVAVGSANLADRNVIAGTNAFFGGSVILNGTGADGSSIDGNLFGMGKNGSGDLGGGTAIDVVDATALTLGSALANTIRHYGKGIVVRGSARNISFAGNRIGASDTLGIDLGSDGITANDANDLDIGANDLQNFPVLTNAQRVPGGVALSGSLDVGHPGSISYHLRAYASAQCHAGGHGDGERILGVQTRTFSSTSESFSYTQSTTDALPAGTVITMTATRTGVGTSEFSACFPLDPSPLVVNNTGDTADGSCSATHCTLREAILDSNNFSGTGLRSIHFAVPPLSGSSEILIQPVSPLPPVTRGVTIDGYTQPGSVANSDATVSNAVPRIRIDGVNAGANATGFNLCASAIVVRGLSVTRFTNAFNGCNGVDSVIAGNFIGLAADGTTAAGNTRAVNSDGVRLRVGGEAPADRNVIADNGTAINFAGAGISGSSVLGNLIGSDRSGTLDRANGQGVQLAAGAAGVVIGSDAAPNHFRFNSAHIQLLASAGIGNVLAANNFGLSNLIPIDLGLDGLTPNDPGDGDSGPNGLQNFPVLTLAERTDSGVRVVGSFDSPVIGFEPSTVAVYASDQCHPNGHGPGTIYLGSFGMAGNAFDVAVLSDVDLVQFEQITATVTRADGTSEMGACIAASDPPPGIAVDSAADSTSTDGGCTQSGDANTCTLREAIQLANAQAGADNIRFAIPGDGPHLIGLAATLPPITGATSIDGYTQLGAVPNADGLDSNAVLKIELAATGLSHALRTCTSGQVEVRGLAIHGGSSATIATRVNDAGNCSANGTLRVRGNWIGFRADGGGIGGSVGILASNTVLQLGGNALADRNVIGNYAQAGVRIFGSAAGGSTATLNLFGLSPDRQQAASNDRSVELIDVSDVALGGTLRNDFTGGSVSILVSGTGSDRNSLFGNRFRGQTGATAIDLTDTGTPNGINPNDVNDVDTGANDGQNTPLLTDASADATGFTINGVLDVPAGIVTPVLYRLTFHRSQLCSDTGGILGGRRGDLPLSSVQVPLSSTSENFSIDFDAPPLAGFVTATATSPDGSTSEISNCLVAPLPQNLFADGFE
ncbi:MAG: CSLREA domain-containing protein [Xanthomonadales bacterium]|nr:CSLREA domain-containing protein [Xanthomonadales bacterium]